MARTVRLESEAGVYHVINRGNYRGPVFQHPRTKEAFLRCLAEACERTGWRVHAWTIMSNHYHLALSTPQANLVDGMCWLQGTFATRFNRFRREHGHLFQGRYKSLLVDPHDGLGAVCHYIHLNPVRAHLCPVERLPTVRWCSTHWLHQGSLRPAWYHPHPLLQHAGQLSDTAAGRRCYWEYLQWLAEDEPAQKRLRFDRMCKGWIIGSEQFVRQMVEEHRELASCGPRLAEELREGREALWRELLGAILRRTGHRPDQLAVSGKSVPWKIAAAAELKARTTVTNRWLSQNLHLGALHEVSRKVSAWSKSTPKS